MPTYVYRCAKCHKEKELYHGMNEDPTIICSCATVMHRKPVAFRFYHNPYDLLSAKLEQGYRNYREKKLRGNKRKPNPTR